MSWGGTRVQHRRDAALALLTGLRRQPDLIGVVLLGDTLAYAYATRRSASASETTTEDCPTCEGRGRVVFLVAPREWARSTGTPPRAVSLVCPLCEGTGRMESDYANFVDFYAAALPQDTARLVTEHGEELAAAEALQGEWINRAVAQQLLEQDA